MGQSRTTGTVVEFCVWTPNRDTTDGTIDMTVIAVHPKAHGVWRSTLEGPTKSVEGERGRDISGSEHRLTIALRDH